MMIMEICEKNRNLGKDDFYKKMNLEDNLKKMLNEEKSKY